MQNENGPAIKFLAYSSLGIFFSSKAPHYFSPPTIERLAVPLESLRTQAVADFKLPADISLAKKDN